MVTCTEKIKRNINIHIFWYCSGKRDYDLCPTQNKCHYDILPMYNKCHVTGRNFEAVHSRSTRLDFGAE